MYNERPNLILGFHGCDENICKKLLNEPNKYKISKENYDWLGHGMYFWENNLERAMEWAKAKKASGRIKKPAVIGAILQLANCCDLTDQNSITVVKSYYKTMADDYANLGLTLPENKNIKNDPHKDMLLRELDCTVLEYMHANIEKQYASDIASRGYSEYKVYDSVRGIFTEGGAAYKGGAIFDKSHIQICIRNSNCIKGFFLPRREKNWP